jgi:alkanesulfonate monooxygenase SsuD/methylene tetrahydromethanopterin reductase-like flavin-dependent oxidoreductase (luciferase family)
MDIGIGLPNAVRGVDRAGIVDWAKRAEAAGFSSLGTIDRIAFANYESLISLAAAGAVTERVRLVTDIVNEPLRSNTALFAKQAATIDHMTGGRLVLGLAVGGRPDDYEASGVDFGSRGKQFDAALAELNKIWNGDTPIGPPTASGTRPTVLIGGSSDKAFARAAAHADGWTMGGGGPDAMKDGLAKLDDAWKSAGRDGKPKNMALMYFALGDDAEAKAKEKLGDYYSFLGDIADQIVAGAAKDADTVKAYVQGFEEAGADEIIIFPANPDPAQVELLAEAVGL